MKQFTFEQLHEFLVELPNTTTMNILNKKENFYLKKKSTELIFKSHRFIIQQNNSYNQWLITLNFYQHLSDFLDYLTLLEKKNY